MLEMKTVFLSRIARNLTPWSLITVYKTIISPHIDYCSSMLFMNNKTDLKKLQVIQNRVMRLILKCEWRTHSKDMLDMLKFQSVTQRINYNTLVLIFKIKNKLLPENLNEIVKFNSDVNQRCVRRQSYFWIPFFRKFLS